MTDMIRTRAGDYVHPLDHVRRRRWRAAAPPRRGSDPTGAVAPTVGIPADRA
jgi:hypothetical protein